MQRSSMLILTAMAVVGVVLFTTRRKPQNAESVQKAAPHALNAKKPKVAAEANAPSARAVTQEAKDAQAGLRAVGYSTTANGQSALKVRVKTVFKCHAGDYEAMAAKVGNAGNILLSLEPIGKKPAAGAKRVSKTVPLRDFPKGATFDLPIASGHGVYGLFLCSDEGRVGACRDKKPADFQALLNHRGSTTGDDAVFYFQMVVTRPESALIYAGSTRGLSNAKEDLAAQDIDGKFLDEDLKKVSTLMHKVQSLAPQTVAAGEDTVIVVPLVIMGGPRC